MGPQVPSHAPPSCTLEISPQRLLPFNRLKQRLEVPFTKAAASLALNDFEEDRRPVLHRPRKDLQHVSFVVAINQNTQPLQLLQRLIDLAHAILQLRIV